MTFRRQSVVSAAVVAACVGATPLRAQAPSGSITGRVVNASTQAPVAGARVTVVGTTLATVTRDDGRFVLPAVPAGARSVRAAFVGFAPLVQSVAVTAGQPATATFALQVAAVALNQVVVVGYGTQRRADLTGSIASVQAQELQQTTVTSVEQGLQGRVAGVTVTQGDAAPGGGIRVQVRGINSPTGNGQPLYVIDGVPVVTSDVSKRQLGSATEEGYTSLTETNPLAQLAPEDIQSVDILKDASAKAIYGSRASNGVVIITTKRGGRDQRGQFTLNASQGYADLTRKLDVLDAYGYAQYANQASYNANPDSTALPYGGRPGTKTPAQIQQEQGAGINWQNRVYRTAPVRDVQLGFLGGDARGSYGVTASALDQAGVITGSQFTRGGLRANLERDVNSAIRVSTNLAVTRSRNSMVRTATQTSNQSGGIVRSAVTYIPFYDVDSAQRVVDPRAVDPLTFQRYGANPLRYTDEVPENETNVNGIGGLRVTAALRRGLSLDLNLGGNFNRRDYSVYFPRTVSEGNGTGGEAIAAGSDWTSFLSENLLRYTTSFENAQRVEAVGGFTFQNDRGSWLSNEVRNFPSDQLAGNVLQNGLQPQIPQSGLSTQQLASWLGRVNYSLLDRYLVTATVRADGSSKFAKNNKWAVFPAFAVAWRASQEPFLRNVRGLSDLKVRASYGRSGNQAIGTYQSLASITGVPTTINEQLVTAAALTQLGNNNLRWETTSEYDVGADLGVWGDRVTATVDYYRKNTYDLLQQITLADNTGFSSAFINSGNVTNRGVELQVGGDVLRAATPRGLTWNLSANASRNRNLVRSLGPVKQQFAQRLGAGGGLEATPFIERPGLPIGALYGYKTDGLFRSQAEVDAYKAVQPDAALGDYRYADLNGDGALTDADRTIIGNTNPRWTFGVSNRFTLGRFDLSGLVTSVRGNSLINVERIRYLSLNGSINVPTQYVAGAFDPATNPDGRYPMLKQSRGQASRFSDAYVEDGSFVRLKNVQLGYRVNLPRAQNARVYVNGINLLTHTKYTGYDPEVSAFGGAGLQGVDQGSYPQSRIVNVGVTTTF